MRIFVSSLVQRMSKVVDSRDKKSPSAKPELKEAVYLGLEEDLCPMAGGYP